ncbi:hypothetical protein LRS10_01645 [Phenylobacterium sp. J426]|uniref:DUF6880 family protein n=1 Tax=Phenylobacterium sp. J426 TaxID=2898439 RepID=UPI002150B861|nr:DUF6880 family protein [Phenylobacterium sp. J426]MCR5873011.1 hypothetical protein [Phenylobacterium sp. J426]
MKRPTPASLKRVTPENLARLGPERLAEILAEVAESRADLKRRLRMELAAEQGAEHLLAEIDRRLTLIGASRSSVSWRQRPAFVRDLDGLRTLVAERLSALDLPAAQDRILRLLGLATAVARRVRDKEGAVAAVFQRAAADAGRLLARGEAAQAGSMLAAAIAEAPGLWSNWAPATLEHADPGLARAALASLGAHSGPAWAAILRRLSEAAGDADAFRATFSAEALRTPSVAAEVAARMLEADRLEEARQLLEDAVRPGLFRKGRGGRAEPDFDWETVWIDYLERAGRSEAAQEARWASFERTLSLARAKAFTARLPDFADVEAEHRIFEIAGQTPDAVQGLDLLLAWPALPEAVRMIEARGDELRPSPEQAEAWAARLRVRYPAAAHTLLRRAAAEAFRRREFATCDRLTEAAEALAV